MYIYLCHSRRNMDGHFDGPQKEWSQINIRTAMSVTINYSSEELVSQKNLRDARSIGTHSLDTVHSIFFQPVGRIYHLNHLKWLCPKVLEMSTASAWMVLRKCCFWVKMFYSFVVHFKILNPRCQRAIFKAFFLLCKPLCEFLLMKNGIQFK